jgi:hypothetical protein
MKGVLPWQPKEKNQEKNEKGSAMNSGFPKNCNDEMAINI